MDSNKYDVRLGLRIHFNLRIPSIHKVLIQLPNFFAMSCVKSSPPIPTNELTKYAINLWINKEYPIMILLQMEQEINPSEFLYHNLFT